MNKKYSGIIWGLVLILLGSLMLLDRLDIIYFDFGDFLRTWWPLVLVIIGLGMIGDNVSKRRQ